MSEPRIITRVILWTNMQVMVFDQDGQQMPEYQGAFTAELEAKINREFRGVWEFRDWKRDVLNRA